LPPAAALLPVPRLWPVESRWSVGFGICACDVLLLTVPGIAMVLPLSVLLVVIELLLCAIAGAMASGKPAKAANVRILMVVTI